MKPVVYAPGARAEYDTAVDWYGSRSAKAGDDFIIEIEALEARISESPAQFPVWQDNPIYRRATLPETFPYALFFRELADHVEILAVAHGARKPGYWLSRR